MQRKYFGYFQIYSALCILSTLNVEFLKIHAGASDNSPAKRQLENWWASGENRRLDPYASNTRGVHVPSLTASQTAGIHGPILLSDTNFIEHMAQFDRERIPERVVHAVGAGAHGYFVVTNDVTKYTKASLFSAVGKQTPIFVRFSTTVGESGTSDMVPENRGFAIKFYTDVGNFNLVGNTLESFPIRDPMLFPSFVRSRKRNPQTHLQDPTAVFDFTSLRPESTNFVLESNSDLVSPDGFRHMDGHAVHTFKLVNAEGVVHFARFHWTTDQGFKNVTFKEAKKLAATNPTYATQDLFDAIATGSFPSWTLSIQVLTEEQAQNYRWNPFDSTKHIYPEDFPFIPVGKFFLNRNPKDFFSEVEMSAFDPSVLVPGIEMSHDPLFIGRGFSYRDTQRHRLGANFDQFEINRPLERTQKIYTYDRDGQCAEPALNGEGGPNYFPNSFGGPSVDPQAKESTFSLPTPRTQGTTVDRYDTADGDDFSQPRIFLQKLSVGERGRLVGNLANALRPAAAKVQERQLVVFAQVDPTFSNEVRAAISFPASDDICQP